MRGQRVHRGECHPHDQRNRAQEAALRAESTVMQQNLKEAESADKQVKSVLEEREQLARDLNAMSGLMDARKFSWARLLSSIETVVPVGVALKKVEFNPRDNTLALDGMAQSPESLRDLVVGLENRLRSRIRFGSVSKRGASFNVVAVYHEQKSAGLAQGKQ
jgi:hypothetical protein